MELGQMTIKEAMKYLKPVANVYGLKLHVVADFKTAKFILAQLYNNNI